MLTIISLGGSIVAPEKPDTVFLEGFRKTVLAYLALNSENRLILIVGGGGPAREWQEACRKLLPDTKSDSLDWIGIRATRLNAELVRAVFAKECPTELVSNPEADFTFEGRILVAAGWKPGFSTDFDAVLLARRFGAHTVINLSNIAKVYTADPKIDPQAKPLDHISWQDFRLMVGDEWTPGKNTPFDPIASREAEKLGLRVICAAGRNLPNLENILLGKAFEGTLIGNT